MRINKQWTIALILALVLMVSELTCAAADEVPIYQLGDNVEDFTVTMTDGEEISLYDLLAEKRAVVLNFWASWCDPCKMEFPYLQETYNNLGADVGMIALSVDEDDTVEVIEELKAALGVTTIPMGRDIGLADRFGVNAYPTSVIIDKNGVVCLIHAGMVTSASELENAMQTFITDEYDKPILLTEMPRLPVTQTAESEKLSAALNAEGSNLQFSSFEIDDTLWPFLPAEDDKSAAASNSDIENSTANVIAMFNANAGDVLLYDVRMTSLDYDDRLIVTNEAEILKMYTGTFDWTTNAIRVEKDGEQSIAFNYARGTQTGYDAYCELRNFRLLTGDEAAAYEWPVSTAPKTLEGKDVSLEVMDVDTMRQAIVMEADGNDIYGQPYFTIANADSVTLKIRIGKDVEESLSAVELTTDIADHKTIMLKDLDHDDEAYYCPIDLTKGLSVTATVKANVLDSDEIGVSASLCVNEAKAPEKPSFTITFTDAAGTPIPGVMAQICDDTTCAVLPSDENGVVKFEGEDHSYELHVLMTPAGYETFKDVIALPASGGAVSVVLTAAAE